MLDTKNQRLRAQKDQELQEQLRLEEEAKRLQMEEAARQALATEQERKWQENHERLEREQEARRLALEEEKTRAKQKKVRIKENWQKTKDQVVEKTDEKAMLSYLQRLKNRRQSKALEPLPPINPLENDFKDIFDIQKSGPKNGVSKIGSQKWVPKIGSQK